MRSRFWSLALAALLAAGGAPPARADAPEPPPPAFVLAWGKKGTGPGEFRSPIGIAIDRDDRVYVTDFYNHQVQKFDDEGHALASFPVAPYPGGIAVDRDGNFYVTPLLLGKVCVYGPDGRLLREWGRTGSKDGEFREPGGIALDRHGNVYVADQSNHRVQKFTRDGKFLAAFGRHGSRPGEFGGKGPVGKRIAGPHFLAFDAAGDLYVTEGAQGRVQKLTPDGKPLLAWGDNGTGPGGFGGREKAKMNPLPGPVGVCLDRRGRAWVSSTNGRVQLFSAEGKYLLMFGGEGDGEGQFRLPHGLAVDGKGYLYVVDAPAHRVQKFAIDRPAVPPEAPADARRRHARVAERRAGTDVICHRGASEHAHENTLEAFRATFELGGDGNEFDIRQTRC